MESELLKYFYLYTYESKANLNFEFFDIRTLIISDKSYKWLLKNIQLLGCRFVIFGFFLLFHGSIPTIYNIVYAERYNVVELVFLDLQYLYRVLLKLIVHKINAKIPFWL